MPPRIYATLKVATAAACAYEAAAITWPHVPTISMLCGRHRWLAPCILSALALHLYWPTREVV